MDQRLFFNVLVFELRADWLRFNVLRGYDNPGMDDVASLNGVPLKNSFKCSMIFLLIMRSISCSNWSFGTWVALNRCMKVDTPCRTSAGVTPVAIVERSAGVCKNRSISVCTLN